MHLNENTDTFNRFTFKFPTFVKDNYCKTLKSPTTWNLHLTPYASLKEKLV